jgi:hypothetical protein
MFLILPVLFFAGFQQGSDTAEFEFNGLSHMVSVGLGTAQKTDGRFVLLSLLSAPQIVALEGQFSIEGVSPMQFLTEGDTVAIECANEFRILTKDHLMRPYHADVYFFPYLRELTVPPLPGGWLNYATTPLHLYEALYI